MTEFNHTPDSLADQLDQTLAAGMASYPVSDPDPLVDAALQVASVPRPGIPAEVRARIQSQILEHVRHQPAPLRPTFVPLLRWALVACAALVILFVPAAQITLASVPGEPLYPVKLTFEQLETEFATSPGAAASIRLTHAERRTQEAQTLLERGQFDPTLIAAAYEKMSQAAAIVRASAEFDSGLQIRIQSQTAALVAAIDTMLIAATEPDQPLAATVTPWLSEIQATQNSGTLLLPATPTSTATATATTAPPTATAAASTQSPMPAATMSETSAPSPTATATTTLIPTVEPTETQVVDLIITGPIEAINGNIIVIYGIEIVLAPDNPLLLTLRVGDTIRISGLVADDTQVVTAVDFESPADTISISPDQQNVWRDNGTCSNPPPPWASARGWRSRCEGQPGTNSNRGGNQNQGQGQGRGQGNNRGGGGSDDDD